MAGQFADTEKENNMAGKVNMDECFERFDDLFSPKIVGSTDTR